MALHTVAFMETKSFTTLGELTPVSDSVFRVVGKGFVPREDGSLIAAAAGGATITAAQVFAPSMEVTPANIHPLNAFPWPSPVGGLYNGTRPPRLQGQEAFLAKVKNTMSGQVAVVVWVCDRIDPVPQGESFLLEFSASVTLAPSVWTKATFSWGVPYLPVGRYCILGMEAHSGTGTIDSFVAARLLLPGQIYRPGTVVLKTPLMLPPAFLMDGSMGNWGYFDQRTPPQIEVLGFGSGAMTVSGFLRVVRESAEGGGKVSWG